MCGISRRIEAAPFVVDVAEARKIIRGAGRLYETRELAARIKMHARNVVPSRFACIAKKTYVRARALSRRDAFSWSVCRHRNVLRLEEDGQSATRTIALQMSLNPQTISSAVNDLDLLKVADNMERRHIESRGSRRFGTSTTLLKKGVVHPEREDGRTVAAPV